MIADASRTQDEVKLEVRECIVRVVQQIGRKGERQREKVANHSIIGDKKQPGPLTR